MTRPKKQNAKQPGFVVVDRHIDGRKSPGYTAALIRLSKLRPGEEWEYHVDGVERSDGVFAAVWDAAEQGTIIPLQKRDLGRIVYIARRR